MKNLLYIIGFFFSAMLFFSCEPNRAEDGDLLFGVVPPKDPPPAETVKYLKEITKFDGQDSTTVTYTYNTDNTLNDVKYDDNTAARFKLNYSEGKVSEIEITRLEDDQLSNTVLNLTYDDNGNIKSASGDTKLGNSIIYHTSTDFTFEGTKVRKIVTLRTEEDASAPDGVVPILKQESSITYTGSNIDKWELKTTTYSAGGAVPQTSTVSFTSYDENKNPFADLPLVFNLVSLHFGAGEEAISGLSKNNVKVMSGKTFNYEYNERKYPTKATVSNSTQSILFDYQQ